MNLYPYQEEGAAWLAGKRAALLADEMGLGKSAQAIIACKRANVTHVVVVCPASVVENWRREFSKFWLEFGHFAVVSYDKAVRGVLTMMGDKVALLAEGATLILDEAHYLKSRTSKRTRTIFGEKCDGVGGLIERADRVILLTGTPMPNDPSELWPTLRALCPEAITGASGKPYSYWQYVKKYCKTKDNGFGIQIVGAKNHADLAERLKPFMLRRTKAEVLDDLPEIAFDELYLEGKVPDGDADVRDATWAVAEVLQKEGVDGLRKIASHVATLRRLTGLAKVPAVVEWVKEFLESTDRKIVLFAHHRDVIDGLVAGMYRHGIDYEVLTGASAPKARQAAIDKFQTGAPRVFIGQIQAAGTGITLTAASDVLFVESSWVPAENSQAAMRVHRIGQRNACLIRFATLAGSIDERIQRAVRRKVADITRILDAPDVETSEFV